MTKNVLFIHGGGEGPFEYDQPLASSLQKSLGSDYTVIYPRMPEAHESIYEKWKDTIIAELNRLDGEVILAGHSFGASVLMKVLAEEKLDTPIAGLFMIAAPFWGAPDWEVDEFVLRDDFADHLPEGRPIYLYHSRDDEVVDYSHLGMYCEKLPQAIPYTKDEGGHQFGEDLSTVAADIRSLQIK